MMWKSLAHNNQYRLMLLAIVCLGLVFRLYGLNWDQGGHLHPDERAIVMALDKMHLPANAQESKLLLTPESPLNPNFFAYGSLPFYLVKSLGSIAGLHDPAWAHYESINLLGRAVSAFFDVGTIVVIFLIGRELNERRLGIWAALFYGIAVLPIQLSHFYAVDSFLTFFVWSALWQLIAFSKHQRFINLILLSTLTGFAVASKVSAVMLIIPIVFTLFIKFLKSPLKLIFKSFLVIFTIVATFIVCEPYALIDYPVFKRQIAEQQAMTKDAFVFPYTLQFVNITPYWYEIKNIFLWGLGPILGALSIVGVVFFIAQTVKRPKIAEITIIIFSVVYFGVVGKFAIGFMRYMLPIYPFLCIGAGYLVSKIKRPFNWLVLILTIIWPLSFMSIYQKPNSRTTASAWIYSHVPKGTIIAHEHWDDGLPWGGPTGNYDYLELPMYEPDSSSKKWEQVEEVLTKAEYIIIASNRLYVPLMKLTDCAHLPVGRCYIKTTQYYNDLFSEKLGFVKVAEFWNLPTIPFTNWQINDFSADETFTVYDHPKIMIFKRT